MAANKQASKQASIHTHVRNAVTLVWGSLRLAPMNHGKEVYMTNHTTRDRGQRKFAVDIPRAAGEGYIYCKLPLTSVSGSIFAIYTSLPWFIYNIWYVGIPYMHSALYLCAMQYFHIACWFMKPLLLKRRRERLNSGSQRNRDLKM